MPSLAALRLGRAAALSLAALLLAATAVAVAPRAASATTAYTVRASLHPSPVVVDQRYTVSGTVSPAAPAAVVKLQRYYDGGWHLMASQRLSSSSTYAFHQWAPSAPQVYKLRVVKPAGAYAAGHTKTRTLPIAKWHYLTKLRIVQHAGIDGDGWDCSCDFALAKGAAEINGAGHDETVKFRHPYTYYNTRTPYVGYNLARACYTLRGVEGLTDNSNSALTGTFDVVRDGTLTSSNVLGFGQSHAIALSVRNTLRLNLQIELGTSRVGTFGWGDVRVLCTF